MRQLVDVYFSMKSCTGKTKDSKENEHIGDLRDLRIGFANGRQFHHTKGGVVLVKTPVADVDERVGRQQEDPKATLGIGYGQEE